MTNDWQLIETAPKNQRILTPAGIAYWGLYNRWYLEGDTEAFTYGGPSHWMPLPEPPKCAATLQEPSGE